VVGIAQAGGAGGGEFGDADIFAVGLVLGDLAVDAAHAAVFCNHFFGVIGRMIGAACVTMQPLGIDTEHKVLISRCHPADDVGRKENVAVAADERLVHQILGAEERGEDVVVLPTGVFAKDELRIVRFDFVDFVASDEADVGEAVIRESLHGPIDQPATGDLGKALGSIGGGGHQAAAPAGGDDYDSHRSPFLCQSTPISAAPMNAQAAQM
jgi:hypothetical protein